VGAGGSGCGGAGGFGSSGCGGFGCSAMVQLLWLVAMGGTRARGLVTAAEAVPRSASLPRAHCRTIAGSGVVSLVRL